jgi:7SK snRNA methylphosphate capping enzyme
MASDGHNKKRPWDEGKEDPTLSALPQYGNFRRYYSIRPEAQDYSQHQDVRLNAILSWLKESGQDGRSLERILDIGCNSGQFTIQLCKAMETKAQTVIGVDVDRELVLLAASTARKLGLKTSRQLGDNEDNNPSPNSFMPRVLGSGRVGRGRGGAPRQRLGLEASHRTHVPLSVQFLQSQWVYNNDLASQRGEVCPSHMTRMQWLDMAEVDRQDSLGYQMILAMSVTKWIHIHHFDSGLRHFFARIASCLAIDGVFIIEQQGYKSYKNAIKLTPPDSQARRNFAALRVMPDDFAWILVQELGLQGPFQIREKEKDCE